MMQVKQIDRMLWPLCCAAPNERTKTISGVEVYEQNRLAHWTLSILRFQLQQQQQQAKDMFIHIGAEVADDSDNFATVCARLTLFATDSFDCAESVINFPCRSYVRTSARAHERTERREHSCTIERLSSMTLVCGPEVRRSAPLSLSLARANPISGIRLSS